MKQQLRYGRMKFISFILLDLLCLYFANMLAVKLYDQVGELRLKYNDYHTVVIMMLVIDVLVSIFFNTLNRVLRRSMLSEIIESVKQVGISFVLLALVLFSTKQGADYSRITVYMAYGFYFMLLVLCHVLWSLFLRRFQKAREKPSALLITTTGYANEGLRVLENAKINVQGMFVTDKTNEGIICDIPVLVDRDDASAALCWKCIDKIYICGPDNMDVPEAILTACRQMSIPVHRAPSNKGFDFEVIKIRTALQKDDTSSGLSFFEGEHDIPFKISRLYTIFGSEQEKQRGFHAHKQSWHMLFCPYGEIDILVDTGRERKHVLLDNPSVGLILHPSVWREMVWKQPESVLCVAASGHYDAETLKDDYEAYQSYLKEKDWAIVIESAEIMGETMI